MNVQGSSGPCLFCAAGKQFVSTTSACPSCVSGKYQDQNNAASATCEICAPGREFHSLSTACDLCPTGRYNHLASFTEDAGDSRRLAAAEAKPPSQSPTPECKACVAGYYMNAEGSTVPCLICAAGKYQDTGASAT